MEKRLLKPKLNNLVIGRDKLLKLNIKKCISQQPCFLYLKIYFLNDLSLKKSIIKIYSNFKRKKPVVHMQNCIVENGVKKSRTVICKAPSKIETESF